MTSDALDALRSEGRLQIARARGSGLAVRSPASTVLNAVPVIGIVSAVADDQRGSAWVRDYAIEDPAWSVKQLLAAAIPTRLGLAEVRNVDTVLTGLSAEVLRTVLGDGHVLVLWTERWTIAKGTGWAPEIALSYQVQSRLIRVSDASVLWRGVCDVRTAGAPMGKWQESGGALLRSEHARAADACGMQLLGQFTEGDS